MTSTPANDHTLRVYSDYVCPFCYLGKHALESYLAGANDPPTVEFRPYDLRGHKRGPDGEIRDVDDGKDEAYFERVRENVDRLSEEYGVSIDLAVARDVDAWNAHQAALWVRRTHPDRFDDFNDAVFEALWNEGRDVGDPDVLADVAASLGLSGSDVAEATRDPELDDAVHEAFEAANRAGISAVPTFVYGDHAARGAVPPDHLRRLVE